MSRKIKNMKEEDKFYLKLRYNLDNNISFDTIRSLSSTEIGSFALYQFIADLLSEYEQYRNDPEKTTELLLKGYVDPLNEAHIQMSETTISDEMAVLERAGVTNDIVVNRLGDWILVSEEIHNS
jgi:hypothetical protein